MQIGTTAEQFGGKNKNKVHKILAHSYLCFFISFLLGLLLDFVFPLKIFGKLDLMPIGIVFLVLGTLLVFWAQKSSRNLEKESLSKETFYRGPYRFTRSPTHFGLFLLVLGFGIVADSFFVVIFSIISIFVAKFFFLKKEERILAEKYGAPYLEYKKSVKL